MRSTSLIEPRYVGDETLILALETVRGLASVPSLEELEEYRGYLHLPETDIEMEANLSTGTFQRLKQGIAHPEKGSIEPTTRRKLWDAMRALHRKRMERADEIFATGSLENLQEVCDLFRITAAAIGDAIGVNHSTVSRFLRGNTPNSRSAN